MAIILLLSHLDRCSDTKLIVQAEDVVDRDNFQCLIGRLIYLSHTRLDIAFAVSMVSQFMHSPRHEHFNVVYRTLRYLKGTLRKRVARSNAEAKLRAVAHGVAIEIAHNPILHDRTKHVEVDKHLFNEKLEEGLICMPYIPTDEQVVDKLTKGLPKKQFDKLVSKLAMEDIFKPT
ncbi:hypothetical protein CK203_043479 [Vitis vinifera]|uniref:Retrovirus-related Pol polyprotein from transposon RE1 n=1 Tax=Vitis vinifera TaxID=29760 RepID=A0A438HRA8_VITVI|nr:hypothetical protein CK203_043479 [Vitis vinifera]